MGGMSRGAGLGGLGLPVGGECGEIVAGQTGMGLLCGIEGGVRGRTPLFLEFGKNLSCLVDIWQTLRVAGARIWLMRSPSTNLFLPPSFEMRASSTGHLDGGREAVSPYVCLWAGTSRMCQVGIWMRVSRLRWLRIVAEYQGVSS